MSLQEWLKHGAPALAQMTPEDVYWSSMLACCEMIRAGITTFADMFFFEDQVAQAAMDSGMRAQVSHGIINPIHGKNGESEADIIKRHIQVPLDTVQRWHGAANGRLTARVGLHSIWRLSMSSLKDIINEVMHKGHGIHTHLSETLMEVEWSKERYGMSPPQVFNELGYLEGSFLAAHGIHLSDEDINILDRSGVGIVHNPASNLRLNSGIAPIPRLTECQNLAIALGTDSAASNDTLDILKEAYLSALIHPWPSGSRPSYRCLEMATYGGARALGLENEIGSIEVGKKADLIILNLENAYTIPIHDLHKTLIYCSRSMDVERVIIDGEVVLEEGVLTKVDEEVVVRKIMECSRRLFEDV